MFGLLRRHAPRRVQQWLWDREFAHGAWNRLTSTPSDFVYSCIVRYARHGAILDLGCGHGTTARELPAEIYERYVGVDLSNVAVAYATKRATPKQSFYVGDLATFVPQDRFDVILFRESLYYLPTYRISSVLSRYADFLTASGVVIVRVWNRQQHHDTLVALRKTLRVIEEQPHPTSAALIVVARP
jgi:SAM-dependent methyltransferase